MPTIKMDDHIGMSMIGSSLLIGFSVIVLPLKLDNPFAILFICASYESRGTSPPNASAARVSITKLTHKSWVLHHVI